MSLDTETQGDTTTIEHFGREWTVPTKRHHTHIRKTKAILRQFGQMDADDVAEVFLSPEDYQALLDLDVEQDALDDFSTKIAKALGMGDRGNSTPSPASS
jgi:hypothetical protein